MRDRSSEYSTVTPFENVLEDVTLAEVAASILAINPGSRNGAKGAGSAPVPRGELCFWTPFGRICVGVNTIGSSGRGRGTDDSNLTLGEAIGQLIGGYNDLQRRKLMGGALSAGGTMPGYNASLVYSVLPKSDDERIKALGIIDVDIDFNF